MYLALAMIREMLNTMAFLPLSETDHALELIDLTVENTAAHETAAEMESYYFGI